MPASAPLRILLVEDNPGDARLARELLKEVEEPRFELAHVTCLADGLARLRQENFAAVLLDLTLGDARGVETVVRMRDAAPHLPIVVLSGLADERMAIEALADGAQDYLVKGQGDGLLMARALRYAIERKRIQQQLLEEKERAELANRAKTDFLANMSHELRTPLNAIIGFSEILKDECFGPVGSPVYKEYARHIHESGAHLLEIINDLLDLSRVEAGRTQLNESEVDVGEAVAACLRVIGERAEEGAIVISETVAADLPRLWCDARMLKQILINMLSNAVKFTPPGGSVTVSARTAAKGGLLLEIADTGIGIAEADIPKAMTPFQQIDNPMSRRFPGTGLGLPLTKSLVELHGGSFSLRSQPGVGTTVTIGFGPERVVALRRREALQVGTD
jgi:signal transduction histidine kinase